MAKTDNDMIIARLKGVPAASGDDSNPANPNVCSNWPTNCEMCSTELARWHQVRPVERWLCIGCAEKEGRC